MRELPESLYRSGSVSVYFIYCAYYLCALFWPFLQGVSGSCKPCTSYDRDVRLSVRPSVTR